MTAAVQMVLVPLDGGPLSETVLPWVRRRAAASPLHVYLLRVLPPSVEHPSTGFGGIESAPVREVARRKAEAYTYLEGFAVDEAQLVARLVRVGDPATEIIAAARASAADLIAMSARCRGGLARMVLGSVAERVVRRAPCPVAVLRPDHSAVAVAAAAHALERHPVR